MKKILLASLLLVFVACGKKETTTTTDNSSHSGHGASGSEIIDLMHAPMMAQAFQKTDNPDVDYLYNMIPHHQGAIDSSKKLLETTTNEQLISLANAIIAEQEKEIAEFTALIPELMAKATSYAEIDTKAFADKAEMLMYQMMAEMTKITISANDDINFIQGMIPHHQGAIDASKQILEVTKDDKIKEIANRIISAQEKEISTMHMLLASLQGNENSNPHAGH